MTEDFHSLDCEIEDCRQCALLDLIAFWRRFDGESGYAQGYADAMREAARALECLLAETERLVDYDGEQKEEANQPAAPSSRTGRPKKSKRSAKSQKAAPKRSKDSRQALGRRP